MRRRPTRTRSCRGTKLATRYWDEPAVLFDFFNEPHNPITRDHPFDPPLRAVPGPGGIRFSDARRAAKGPGPSPIPSTSTSASCWMRPAGGKRPTPQSFSWRRLLPVRVQVRRVLAFHRHSHSLQLHARQIRPVEEEILHPLFVNFSGPLRPKQPSHSRMHQEISWLSRLQDICVVKGGEGRHAED